MSYFSAAWYDSNVSDEEINTLVSFHLSPHVPPLPTASWIFTFNSIVTVYNICLLLCNLIHIFVYSQLHIFDSVFNHHLLCHGLWLLQPRIVYFFSRLGQLDFIIKQLS